MKVNKTDSISTLRFQIALTFIVALLLTSWSNSTNAQTLEVDSVKSGRFFVFTPIAEVEFRSALKSNYNAPFVTTMTDTVQLEKALMSIDKTYNVSEIELAKRELCKSPRCLTFFKAYYPALELYLFNILDYQNTKASFVFAGTNEMASGYQRFSGDYGVMSQDGLWVGLERQDADNYLQMEICATSKHGVWSLFKFEYMAIDINEKEKIPMFWADKNTIYIATREYDHNNGEYRSFYYAIKFEH